jgi:pimeloyl-ACP methyl ester carboxylesterase
MTELRRLEPLQHVHTDVLDVAYHEDGPADGPPVILLHGFPYDIHSYIDVAPRLAGAEYRVIVPYLRGHGPTRFLDAGTPRSGQQAALGADVLGLMEALAIPSAVLAGYDWGGRAACVVAALRPERVSGLVTLNSYLIQDLSTAMTPIRPDLEAACGTSSTSSPSAATRVSRRTGAVSRRSSGDATRRGGPSPKLTSTWRPRPSTTPTTWTWSSTPTAIVSARHRVRRPTRSGSVRWRPRR